MINRINFTTPQYKLTPAFKGEKEVKMLVEKANKVPQKTNEISDFGYDLDDMLENGEVSEKDVETAKQRVEGWRKQLF